MYSPSSPVSCALPPYQLELRTRSSTIIQKQDVRLHLPSQAQYHDSASMSQHDDDGSTSGSISSTQWQRRLRARPPIPHLDDDDCSNGSIAHINVVATVIN